MRFFRVDVSGLNFSARLFYTKWAKDTLKNEATLAKKENWTNKKKVAFFLSMGVMEDNREAIPLFFLLCFMFSSTKDPSWIIYFMLYSLCSCLLRSHSCVPKTKDRNVHFQLIFSYESIANRTIRKKFFNIWRAVFIAARVVFHSLNLKSFTEND